MRWVGLKTLIRRECAVVLRNWGVTLAPPVISTALYFLVFGQVMRNRIGPVDGFLFDRFVAPGLVVLSVIPGSFIHTAAGLLGARIFRYIEELLVAPLPDWIILTGYVIGGVLRGSMVAAAVTATALLFIPPEIHSIVASGGALLMAALATALLGFITSTFAKSFEHVTTALILIVAPLTYIGGVFTPISTLPEWAQRLSFANPMFYFVNALRFGVLGVSDVPIDLAMSFGFAFVAALLVAAIMRLRRGSALRGEGFNA